MRAIVGVYHFWPKRVGFRNDYCLGCEKPRRAVAVRTFDVGHFYWIPILPFGYWKHWKCSECNRDPHRHVKTRRVFKWIGFGCLLLLATIFWFAPIGSGEGPSWVFRIGAPIGAAFLLLHLLRNPAEPSLRARLAGIPPAAEVVCPFCTTALMSVSGGPLTCPSCQIVRY